MKYDFTSILDRRGKDAIAIDAVGVTGLKPENIGFTHCLTDNGYHIVHSPLVKVDFRALERMAADKN